MERPGSIHSQLEEAPLGVEHWSREGAYQSPCRKEHTIIGDEEALSNVKFCKFTKCVSSVA